MPTKLNLAYFVDSRVFEKFPGATSVSVSPPSYAVELLKTSGKRNEPKFRMKRSFLQPLSGFTKLEHLNVNLLFCTLFRRFPDCWLSDFDHLTSFAIRARAIVDINSLFAQIGHLTKLTSLTIEARQCEQEFVTEPITGLCGIQHLRLECFLTNDDGHLMFPSLTNLTCMECVFHRDQLTADDGDALKVQQSISVVVHEYLLQVILPYASTLRKLKARIDDADLVRWTSVKAFESLESVDMWPIPRAYDLCSALKDTCMLTSLKSIVLVEDSGVFGILRSMSQLKSLDVFDRLDNDQSLSHLFLGLPQLTQLRIRDCEHGSCLTHLDGLVDLWFDADMRVRPINLRSALAGMPQLERLKISNLKGAYLRGDCINQLHQLKSLTVEGVKLDKVFFATLSSLTGLTELGIIDCMIIDDSHISTICSLPLLEKLTLMQSPVENPLDFISDGKLLQLKIPAG